MEIRSSIGPANGKTANPCDIKSGRFSFFKKGLLGGVFVLALFCSFSSALAQVSLLYQKDGSATSDRLGWSVAGVGDVNGDGRADFIVGAALADPGGISNAGSAYLYSGASGALLYQKNGSGTNGQLGWSVAGAGDVNGDGRGDFIVGSPNTAFVYSGATGALLYQKSAGYSVGGAGDVDGDGRA
ncbi:MAG: integrin alpha, partial [candidate division Zixibacteria bacterium]|nr:integrin alpha [candidate division Zixibacteria bacterium]